MFYLNSDEAPSHLFILTAAWTKLHHVSKNKKKMLRIVKSNNTSPKYEDIISKSVLTCSGSPAVYQLMPKKEKIGTLT
ncbi:hypothetical protein EXN66_Car017303 [Channa argus]|uniref:Uncharacterized protein n=1 Tax=Channa argus TaxID=215402 RepID=A0A6G1QGD2_CHAAH|nr:hypothetical protein EXN66_Car017303 [Channa argus]